jgi:hypothetical protein
MVFQLIAGSRWRIPHLTTGMAVHLEEERRGSSDSVRFAIRQRETSTPSRFGGIDPIFEFEDSSAAQSVSRVANTPI